MNSYIFNQVKEDQEGQIKSLIRVHYRIKKIKKLLQLWQRVEKKLN